MLSRQDSREILTRTFEVIRVSKIEIASLTTRTYLLVLKNLLQNLKVSVKLFSLIQEKTGYENPSHSIVDIIFILKQ